MAPGIVITLIIW